MLVYAVWCRSELAFKMLQPKELGLEAIMAREWVVQP